MEKSWRSQRTTECNTETKKAKHLGPDGMLNEIFIEANETTTRIVLNTIKKINWEENDLNNWLQGNIIRLCKGTGTKGKCSNERGINLTSNVGKVYERIIKERKSEGR